MRQHTRTNENVNGKGLKGTRVHWQ